MVGKILPFYEVGGDHETIPYALISLLPLAGSVRV